MKETKIKAIVRKSGMTEFYKKVPEAEQLNFLPVCIFTLELLIKKGLIAEDNVDDVKREYKGFLI